MTSVRRNCAGGRGGRATTGLPLVCSRSPTRWKGWTVRARRGWPGWTGRPCATGFIATKRKGLPGSAAGALAEVDRGSDGGAEGGGAGRARPGGGRGGALAHCRSVPLGGGALGCQLQRDRDAAAVVVIGSVAPQDPAA